MATNPIDLLNSLKCVRISSDKAHKEMIKSFSCQQNKCLTEYIRKKAWEDDSLNRKAVYLVKDDKSILFYFSLQCSTLYEPFNKEEMAKSFENFNEIEPYLKDIQDITQEDDFSNHIMRLLEANIIATDKFRRLMEKFRLSGNARRIRQDEHEDFDNNLPRVNKCIPTIELVHFCANDKTKGVWDANTYQVKLGAAIFFWFISPIVEDIYNKIGCSHLFLFAADESRDNELIKYYKATMNFDIDKKLIPIKSAFSLFCTPLCQKIANMKTNREAFTKELIKIG